MPEINEKKGDVNTSNIGGENKPLVVNSTFIPVSQSPNDNGEWLPFKKAKNPDGQEIVSSWVWSDSKNIPESKKDNLDELQQKKFEDDPYYYENTKTLHMSELDKDKYSQNKMYLLELERLKNEGKPVILVQNIIDRALNISEGEIELVKKQIEKLREARKNPVAYSHPKLGERQGFNADIISKKMEEKEAQADEIADEMAKVMKNKTS